MTKEKFEVNRDGVESLIHQGGKMLSRKHLARIVCTYGMVAMALWSMLLPTSLALGQQAGEERSFLLFDGTLYKDKPDFSAYGIRPISLAYAGALGTDWHRSPEQLPDKKQVEKVARESRTRADHVVIDIEHWPLHGDAQEVGRSIRKFLAVLEWFKEAVPSLNVGFYGAPPIRDYWRVMKGPASREWGTWKQENDALRSLADAVDTLYPSLYTFYSDQEGWVRFARAQIEEARRYGKGKPVYVFLWPQYHNSNRMLAGTYLPADYWRLELDTARQYADGIILWGGWGSNNRPAKWDDDATWWKVTKDFIKTIQGPRASGNPKAE